MGPAYTRSELAAWLISPLNAPLCSLSASPAGENSYANNRKCDGRGTKGDDGGATESGG